MRCSAASLSFIFSIIIAVEGQYVNLPLTKQVSTSAALKKRQISNGSLVISSQATSYLANISFGTPSQSVQLILDTGSPLTWVNAQNVSTFTPGSVPSTAQKTAGQAICQSFECLNSTQSSTLTVPSNTTIFDIQYVDGTESIGQIVQDTMSFQGLTDNTFEFGLVEYFYSPGGVSAALSGILGLSPPNPVLNFHNLTAALTATTATSYFTPQTILNQLLNAGAIKNVAFSLYLSETTDGGQLTIGGVDSGRYTGPLTVLPIETDSSSQGQSFYVTLESIGSGGSTSNELSVNTLVVLDSGTTSMYLPASVVEQLASNLNGYFIPYDSSSGLLGIPCTTQTTIDFYFDNSAVIRIPTSAILDSELTPTQARRAGIRTNANICVLSLFGTAASDTYLLGDSFLRSAYVVYDTTAGNIAIAQSSDDKPSNITAIGAGDYGIPGAIYNSSSPNTASVAVIPSITRTIAIPTNAAQKTSATGTLSFTATDASSTATTTSTSSAHRAGKSGAASYILMLTGGCVVAGLLML